MYIDIIQIVSAILLIALILLQNKGTSLGSAFGGDSSVYRTKRGVEKWIFNGTIIVAIVFLATAFANLIL